MSNNELVNYFDKTNINWSNMRDSSLIDFVVHTKLYINNFNFAGVDGLSNFKSNLHTLYKEAKIELNKRGLKYE
jgi:hypothetical protein